MRAAALRTAQVLAFDLPAAYLVSAEEDAYRIIHDFQNKLLNAQLQHELFYRLFDLPQVEPQPPLPDRDAAAPLRIAAIAGQLSWWSDFYAARYSAEIASGSRP